MNIQIYKPNKSNTGFGFSFSAGDDKKRELVLFVNGIAQYSWNNGSGTFQGNSNNPENLSAKFMNLSVVQLLIAWKKSGVLITKWRKQYIR